MNTRQHLDDMANEYGTSSWRKIRFARGWNGARGTLTPNQFVSIVISMIMGHDSPFWYFCDNLFYQMDKDHAKIDTRLIGAFFNKRKPTWVADNLANIVEEWHKVNGRPNTFGSSYNLDVDHFVKLYFIFKGNIPCCNVRNREFKYRGKTSILMANKSLKAAKWALMTSVNIDSMKLSDVYRAYRGGHKVWSILGLFKQTPSNGNNVDWELVNKVTYHGDGKFTVNGSDCDTLRALSNIKEHVLKKNNWAEKYRHPGIEGNYYFFFNRSFKWMNQHRFIPKSANLYREEPSVLLDKKLYMSANKRFSSTIENDCTIFSLFINKFFTLGNYRQFLDYMNKRGINDHDACSGLIPGWMRVEQGKMKDVGDYIMRNKDASLVNLKTVLNNWLILNEENKKMKIGDLCALIESNEYMNVHDRLLAIECKKHKVSQMQFQNIQDRVLKIKKNREQYESIPAVESECNGYRMYRLDKEDYRGLFLGEYTNCCQTIGNAGGFCAWHGFQETNGAFYVVEDKKGKIVAQSWVWRHNDEVVFDNIECLGSVDNRAETLKSLYIDVSNKMIGVLCIKRVNVGTGHDGSRFLDSLESIDNPMNPRELNLLYSDAKTQKLLASA